MSDENRVQLALKKYYREKLRGKGNIRVSDVRYIQEGIGNNMYSFHLEYVENANLGSPSARKEKDSENHDENLILRMSVRKGSKLGEFQVLEKLYHTSVPVPKVYDVGEDMLGSGFIIMEKMQGQNMMQSMDDIIAGGQAQLWRQYSTILANIHMLDWEEAGFGLLPSLDPPQGKYGYVDRYLSKFRKSLRWRKWIEGRKTCNANRVIDWLEENKPASDHYVLLHGDYYLNNAMVYEGEITAIVDWDGVAIGDAAFDLCQVILVSMTKDLSDEWHSKLTDSFLEHYEEVTGTALSNIDFYLIIRAIDLLDSLGHPNIDAEWINSAIRTCAGSIEKKTGISS